ncbi:hypothetical protein D3C76_1722880 [compost metagenome]
MTTNVSVRSSLLTLANSRLSSRAGGVGAGARAEGGKTSGLVGSFLSYFLVRVA